MATKREQFQELRRGGMDSVKAQEQVYGAMPTAPTFSASVTPAVANIGGTPIVAPVAPPIAPITPEIVPKVAETQSMVPPQRDITKESIFTPPPTAEVPKIETLGEKNLRQQSEFAQKTKEPTFMTEVQREAKFGQVQDNQASKDQMIANVGIMAKEDPTVATNRDKFNAKTGYIGKSTEEKAILDNYFQANAPKSVGDIKTALASGVEITDPKIVKSPAFRQAKYEKETLAKYTNMTPTQLFGEMKNGIPTNISSQLQNTPAYQEAMAKYDNYKKVDNINSASQFLVNGKSKEVDPLTQLSQQLTQIYSSADQGGDSLATFKQYISENPEITGKTAEYNLQTGQKKELERARGQLVGDLKKQYTGLPLSAIMVLASTQAEPLNKQIDSLNDSLSVLGADIKYQTDLANKEFDIYREDQQAKTAKQSKLQDLLGGLAVSQFSKGQDQAFDLQKMDVQQKYQADRDTQNYLQDLQKMGISNVYDLQKMGASQEFQKELVALNNKYENSRSVRDFQNDLQKMGFQFDLQKQSKALDLRDSMAMEEYKASLNPDIAEKWDAIRQKATENTSLADLYGTNVGTYKGNRGYDLAGKMGDAIVAPPGARVVSVNSINTDGTIFQLEDGGEGKAPVPMSIKDPGYGNSVLLELPDGKFMRLSHLQSINANVGQQLAGGAVVGTRGNTGNVRGRNEENLTAEQLAAGRGAHVDVEISNNRSFDKANLLGQGEQIAYLKSIKPFANSTAKEEAKYSTGDVGLFNSAKYNPQTDKDTKRVERYYQFLSEKANIQEDPNSDPIALMQLSRGQKDLGTSENKAYKDTNTVVAQLGSLRKSIDDYNKSGVFSDKLNPITSLIQNNNPWNEKSQLVQAQLQALVPKVARGVFGEVGVLTDADIANYMKTLPTIKQTANVQDVVQYALLDTLKNSLDSAIAIDSGTYDTSGIIGQYKKLTNKISELENKIVERGNDGDEYDNYLKNL